VHRTCLRELPFSQERKRWLEARNAAPKEMMQDDLITVLTTTEQTSCHGGAWVSANEQPFMMKPHTYSLSFVAGSRETKDLRIPALLAHRGTRLFCDLIPRFLGIQNPRHDNEDR